MKSVANIQICHVIEKLKLHVNVSCTLHQLCTEVALKARVGCYTCLLRFMVFILEAQFFSGNAEAVNKDVRDAGTLHFMSLEQYVCHSRPQAVQKLMLLSLTGNRVS